SLARSIRPPFHRERERERSQMSDSKYQRSLAQRRNETSRLSQETQELEMRMMLLKKAVARESGREESSGPRWKSSSKPVSLTQTRRHLSRRSTDPERERAGVGSREGGRGGRAVSGDTRRSREASSHRPFPQRKTVPRVPGSRGGARPSSRPSSSTQLNPMRGRPGTGERGSSSTGRRREAAPEPIPSSIFTSDWRPPVPLPNIGRAMGGVTAGSGVGAGGMGHSRVQSPGRTLGIPSHTATALSPRPSRLPRSRSDTEWGHSHSGAGPAVSRGSAALGDTVVPISNYQYEPLPAADPYATHSQGVGVGVGGSPPQSASVSTAYTGFFTGPDTSATSGSVSCACGPDSPGRGPFMGDTGQDGGMGVGTGTGTGVETGGGRAGVGVSCGCSPIRSPRPPSLTRASHSVSMGCGPDEPEGVLAYIDKAPGVETSTAPPPAIAPPVLGSYYTRLLASVMFPGGDSDRETETAEERQARLEAEAERLDMEEGLLDKEEM
ncbi:hypothetical protein KIPB_006003, partial [Kipferlia bialata]